MELTSSEVKTLATAMEGSDTLTGVDVAGQPLDLAAFVCLSCLLCSLQSDVILLRAYECMVQAASWVTRA